MTRTDAKGFVFTITTGRSGTVYLAKLLKDNFTNAEVHHERRTFERFGIDTPDASHFMTFNSIGNTEKVRAFWRQKLERDSATKAEYYIEVSHFLSKAGLFENIDILRDKGEVDVLVLKRDVFKTLWSYINHFDFMNYSFTWLFTLDPRYPNKIVDSRSFMRHGFIGAALWYIYEMYTRAEYYKLLLKDVGHVRFHDVSLEEIVKPTGAAHLLSVLGAGVDEAQLKIPARMNATKEQFFSEAHRTKAWNLIQSAEIDPKALAGEYFEKGQRLGSPNRSPN